MGNFTFSVDVGNSRVKYGLLEPVETNESSQRSTLATCIFQGSTSHDEKIDWTEIRQFLEEQGGAVAKSVIAGSHPLKVGELVSGWPQKDFQKPKVVNNSSEIPIESKVEFPETVGIDRLLNAFAANALRDENQSAIIVDNGTAMTVDLVDSSGVFCGGAILPGFELLARALHEYTALLPYIEIEEIENPIPFPVGNETRSAIRSGLFWGQIGAVRELIERFETELQAKSDQPPLKFLTGGGAGLISKILKDIQLEPYLALQGLALLSDIQNAG